MTPDEMRDMFGGGGGGGGDDPFSDFFHTFFGGSGSATGGGRGGRATRPTRGSDLEASVDLTLDEAFAGSTRRLSSTDNGRARSVEVRIPAGVKDGARVRAAGEGEPAPKGGSAGDLYLNVRVLPHARFERRGQDLHVKVPVPVTTAVLGGDVSVPTISGTSLRLKIPELTPAGRVFRLKGHGMPTVGKAAERGDLYATVELQMPASLSDEERVHYEELKKLQP
jgi:DnaJ-class molecular chaperone